MVYQATRPGSNPTDEMSASHRSRDEQAGRRIFHFLQNWARVLGLLGLLGLSGSALSPPLATKTLSRYCRLSPRHRYFSLMHTARAAMYSSVRCSTCTSKHTGCKQPLLLHGESARMMAWLHVHRRPTLLLVLASSRRSLTALLGSRAKPALCKQRDWVLAHTRHCRSRAFSLSQMSLYCTNVKLQVQQHTELRAGGVTM